jgi:hypothetical protein
VLTSFFFGAQTAPVVPIKSVGPDHPLHLVRLKGYKNAIDSAIFSPDGRYLGVCDSTRVVRVYFAESLAGKDHRYVDLMYIFSSKRTRMWLNSTIDAVL